MKFNHIINEISKIAVVGTGSIGSRHLKILKEKLNVNPIAIPKRRDRKTFWRKRGYNALSELPELKDREMGLAIIASNTSCHLNDSINAMNKGYDLLIEKPMCANLDESLSLYEHGKKMSAKIFIGFDLRFSESLNVFRELVGELGTIYSVRVECQSWLPTWRPHRPYKDSYSAKKDEGGVLRDLVHDIDYSCWLFGPPIKLHARMLNLNVLEIEAEEFVEVFWETGGPAVSICLDYITKPAKRIIRAHGEYGSMVWDAMSQKVTSKIGGRENVQEYSQDVDSLYEKELECFIKSCSDNTFKCDKLANAQDGLQIDIICEAIRNSARDKNEVTL
jgi:predicted dehydrogenase